MGAKQSAPPAPDPYAVSNAQTNSNLTTALANADLNHYTTNTPLGSQSWSISGYQTVTDPSSGKSYQIPNYVQNDTLTPTGQQELTTQQQNQLGQAQTEQGFLNNVEGQLQNPITQNDFAPINTSVGSGGPIQNSISGVGLYNQQGTGAEQQAFGNEYSLVQPLMQQQTQQTQDQLRAEGIPEGSDLWNTEMQNVGRQQSNQIAGLASNAVGLGEQEQQQLFGQNQAEGNFANTAQGQEFTQGLQGAEFGNAAEQQQMQQALALRNQPLNELNALQTGSQVATPQFQPTANVSMAPTNVSGNVYSSYQGAVNATNAANALTNNTFSSLLNAGGNAGSAAIMSDERVKKDIEPTGIELHEYRYKWEPEDGPKHVGVIAQDVEKKFPGDVTRARDGTKMVKLAQLLMTPHAAQGA